MTVYCTKRPFSTTLVWVGLLFVSLMWTGCTDVEPFEADMRSGNVSKRALKREVMSMEMVAEGGLTLPDLFKTWSAENSGLLLSLGSGDISMKWAESEYYDTGGAEILMTPIASDYKVALRRVTMEKKRRRVEMASMYSYLYVKKSKVTGRKVDYVISFSPDRRYMKKHKTDLVSCFHYVRGRLISRAIILFQKTTVLSFTESVMITERSVLGFIHVTGLLDQLLGMLPCALNRSISILSTGK